MGIRTKIEKIVVVTKQNRMTTARAVRNDAGFVRLATAATLLDLTPEAADQLAEELKWQADCARRNV